MDLCRVVIVAALAALILQVGGRLSYDADHGLRLAAASGAHVPA